MMEPAVVLPRMQCKRWILPGEFLFCCCCHHETLAENVVSALSFKDWRCCVGCVWSEEFDRPLCSKLCVTLCQVNFSIARRRFAPMQHTSV